MCRIAICHALLQFERLPPLSLSIKSGGVCYCRSLFLQGSRRPTARIFSASKINTNPLAAQENTTKKKIREVLLAKNQPQPTKYHALSYVVASNPTPIHRKEERMPGELKHSVNPWTAEQSSRIAEFNKDVSLMSGAMVTVGGIEAPETSHTSNGDVGISSNEKLGLSERAFSAAGAAFLSAILVNPLDVAKTRLQAQAAGVPYSHPLSNLTTRMGVFGPHMMFADLRCSPSCTRAGVHGTVAICPPDCFHYKGTLDVFYKIVRQEGFSALWRGTNAGLALAIPTVGIYLPCYDIFRNQLEEFTARNAPGSTPYVPLVAGALARSIACISCYPIELARTRMQAFKHHHGDKRPPGVLKTLVGVVSQVKSTTSLNNSLQNYRYLWTGLGAQLARDVPFSAICWSTLEPVRRRLLGVIGDEATAVSVLGVNFSAGFVAGSLAAAATCPLDVAKTRRQIERDPTRALRMTTRRTLLEVWRDGGMKGMFAGVGPRVGRAGPSVGIVVSFYEVVKYVLQRQYNTT